ncbi:hypothetical protein KDD30_21925 (plasmid) [Photobacterium sp. GJ3]|uniref:hypothetical protein n=1 Tax=Photobacterium sp. GJ3 TaxID=2829502 RepID=UPI001B8D01BF|nr:hypothetical protein [Photobacterium sp. GJ3]QUJ69421.1 hypothetical protein KDD30_21925 [Photobacterium sp. GJ3]
MNKVKKSVIAALGLSVIGGSAAYGYFYVTNPYDEEYMENLKSIVASVEKSDENIPHVAWPIFVDIPQGTKIEEWNSELNLPQIQFFYKGNENIGKGSLYTMNLDGSDVRILFSQEEIGGVPEIRGLSRPSRSPDGRYIITSIQPRAFRFSCAVYDLKIREKIDLGKGRCYNFNWNSESNGVYYIGGNSWQSPYYFDLNKRKLVELNPDKDNFFEDLSFKSDLAGGYPIDNNKFFIRQVKGDENKLNKYYGKGFRFKLPEMTYVGVENYYPDGCNYGQNLSADGKYFTCVYAKSGKYYYSKDNPDSIVGEAREELIIQAGKWYMKENSNTIYRHIRDDIKTPLSGIYYAFKESKSKDIIHHLSYFLPENLKDNYKVKDFGQYFPPIPDYDIYKIALNEIQKED